MFGIVVLKRVFVSGFGCVLPGCRCFTSSELARRKFLAAGVGSRSWLSFVRCGAMARLFSFWYNDDAARQNLKLKKVRASKKLQGARTSFSNTSTS